MTLKKEKSWKKSKKENYKFKKNKKLILFKNKTRQKSFKKKIKKLNNSKNLSNSLKKWKISIGKNLKKRFIGTHQQIQVKMVQ